MALQFQRRDGKTSQVINSWLASCSEQGIQNSRFTIHHAHQESAVVQHRRFQTTYGCRRLRMEDGRCPVPDSNKKLPTHEEIALRAVEIYMKLGGGNGGELDDWL